jgi:hypothetical protein
MRHSRQLLHSEETLRLELLTTTLNRLDIPLEKSPILYPALQTVKGDMERMRLRKIKPFFYLSTGYGTIEGTTNICLGFYDYDDRYRALNKEFRGWNYTYEEVVATIRHEVGHAFAYAYKLYRVPEFREVFNVHGNYFRTYPLTERYINYVNPWSRDYVNPSGDHYAQKHPDDDFAETFMVWLTPRLNWRKKWRNYPGALRKLEYVDQVVKEYRGQEPLFDNTPYEYEGMDTYKMTLAQFFKGRPTYYRKQATGFVDSDLKYIFRERPKLLTDKKLERGYLHADNFLRKNQRVIATRVSQWVGVEQVVVDDLIVKCRNRADDLDLWIKLEDQEKKLVEFTTYVSARCAYYYVWGTYFP